MGLTGANGGATGFRLVYKGDPTCTDPHLFHCAGSGSLITTGNSTYHHLNMCVNGNSSALGCQYLRTLSSTQWNTISFHKVLQLSPGDYISIFAQPNVTNPGQLAIANLNIVAMSHC